MTESLNSPNAHRAAEIMSQVREIEQTNQLEVLYGDTYENGHQGGPYPWQCEWHAAGAKYDTRAIISGSQLGKTLAASAETAIHLTGLYPDWWKGHRFKGPITAIVGEPTNEMSRNIAQQALCGPMEEGEKKPSGKGWIPAECIVDWEFRQCGVRNVLDYVKVRHVSGGTSTCYLQSYEQGPVKFQGTTYDLAWMDEEPEDKDGDIVPEIHRGLMVKGGHFMLTRTPLFGSTPLIESFVSGDPDQVYYKQVGVDDAPHMTPEKIEKAKRKYPKHEWPARLYGIPSQGSGGVYPIEDDVISIPPFEIPAYFARLCGIDFGIDHPFAAVWIAWDRDADVIYVYDAYRQSHEASPYHVSMIKSRSDWIPVSWPHDGMNRDKGSGEQLKKQFEDQGANMLPLSARYDDDVGGGQKVEPIVQEIEAMMRLGKFKVFSHLSDWFQEKRMYHREDGKIVARNDDLMSATNYAVMMRRYAMTRPDPYNQRQTSTEMLGDYDPVGSYLAAG